MKLMLDEDMPLGSAYDKLLDNEDLRGCYTLDDFKSLWHWDKHSKTNYFEWFFDIGPKVDIEAAAMSICMGNHGDCQTCPFLNWGNDFDMTGGGCVTAFTAWLNSPAWRKGKRQ